MNNTKIIGIAGTAKNTGKTTTLSVLIEESYRRKIPIAVTGIGFDGEELDTVTLLPKPRLTVYPQTIITTSEKCLEISTAKTEILHRTGFFTSLGEILILRVVNAGMIVIAGPNKKSELQKVTAAMKHFQPKIIFVDGSLNRIAPMSVVNSIIFTTGGARSTNIEKLAEEMKTIEFLFHIPIAENSQDLQTIETASLLDADDVDNIVQHKNITTIKITNYISTKALQQLAEFCTIKNFSFSTLIIENPFVLLINENIVQTADYVNKIQNSGIKIFICQSPKLSGITINPFYPMLEGNRYLPQFLDKKKLLQKIQSVCSSPIFNIRETSPAKIMDLCLE